MTTSPSTGQPDRQWEDLLAEAVRVLTAAGRLTRPPHPQAAAAQSADPVGPLATEPRRADWAEFVSLALACVAANLGGIDAALTGRPGSWEADHVRTLLHSTIGDTETQLLRHRTEPVTVTVYVEELLVDLGIWTAFENAQAELSRQAQTVKPSTPTPSVSTQTRTPRTPWPNDCSRPASRSPRCPAPDSSRCNDSTMAAPPLRRDTPPALSRRDSIPTRIADVLGETTGKDRNGRAKDEPGRHPDESWSGVPRS